MLEYNISKKHYHTLDYYLKTKYQKKVFKVALNASFSCPNRDGSKGINGCAFCSLKGSGDYAGNPNDSLITQFEKVKQVMQKKWHDAYYIAYFQAYSNTYAPLNKLKETFEPFINYDNVIGMSIATRCDCINEENVNYLKELKTHFKEFWVELGLQSAHKKTMNSMNLKYTFSDFKKAVYLLNKANIDVVVHIINGLNESKEKQIQTIQKVSKLPIKGIKIHMLNIIKNTTLANIYKSKPFHILSEDEFIDIVTTQIAYLKDDVIIHRIGADSNSNDLIAPLWVEKKLAIMDKIDNTLNEKMIFQGDLYQK
ncbi:MAG: TIGR01212 family radical SAM protein [Erysipelotrichaceae bacterium]|nr:TIGR01212 family radical SAM protein [Erysipelotrichaceae bacterium]